MTNIKKQNIFTDEEISTIKNIIQSQLMLREYVEWNDNEMGLVSKDPIIKIKRNDLGRLEIGNLKFPKGIIDKIFKIAEELFQVKEHSVGILSDITYVEYNTKYSNNDPVLRVHKDQGECGLILDYQLESNTSWDIGIEEDVYSLSDNEVIALHPITYYHWRPYKKWQEGEYVRLIFFEFHIPGMAREEDISRKNYLIKYAMDYNDKVRDMMYNKDGGLQ